PASVLTRQRRPRPPKLPQLLALGRAPSRPAYTPPPPPAPPIRGGTPGRPASVRTRQRRPRPPKPTEPLAVGSKSAGRQTATDTTHRNTWRNPRPTGGCSSPATSMTATQTDGAPGSGPGSKWAG